MSEFIKNANAPFAKGLQIVLAKKGIKQSNLEREIGMERCDITKIINGRRLARASEIDSICSVLGYSVDEVFKAGEVKEDER